MRNADDDLVDRSSEKITPGSGISRCQEAKNPPLGGIIIILSSSHLIILIIILISNPCYSLISSLTHHLSRVRSTKWLLTTNIVQQCGRVKYFTRKNGLRHSNDSHSDTKRDIVMGPTGRMRRFWVEAQFGLCHVPDIGEQITEKKK